MALVLVEIVKSVQLTTGLYEYELERPSDHMLVLPQTYEHRLADLDKKVLDDL